VLLAALLSLAAAPSARADDVFPLPGIRVTGGAVWHVDPKRDVVGAVDVLPNITFLDFEDGFYIAALFGYGFEGGGDNTHLFVLGGDIGYLPGLAFGASLGLRGVLGSVDGDFGGGMRVVAGMDLWFGVFRLETGYQVLAAGHGAEHDLRVTAGIDVLRLLVIPFIAGAAAH